MSNVPEQLVNLALDALEEEVACWRRVPWREGKVRLMRFPTMEPIGVSDIEVDGTMEVAMHDVNAADADNIIVRFAIEKVVEAVIGAISVAP
jgi:hypothetical protein